MNDYDPTPVKSPIDHYTIEDYTDLLQSGQNIFDEYQIALLQVLIDEPSVQSACVRLGVNKEWIEQVVQLCVHMIDNEQELALSKAKEVKEPEQVFNRNGSLRLRRLANVVLLKIAKEHDGLNEQEKEILRAAALNKNQALAALSIGMDLQEFSKRILKIRRNHGF